jgi:glycosyltransferase involved in cell wall biosynthesis
MKLALVSGEFPPMQGGVGDYTHQMALEFAHRGIDVRVVTSPPQRNPGSSPPSAQHSGQPYALTYTRFPSWRSLSDIHALTRECDIVHIQYQAAAYGLTPPIHLLPRYLRWRQPRRVVVVTFHDLRVPYLFPKAGALRWWSILYLAASCHAVVVTNQEDLLTLQSAKGFRDAVSHAPIGIQPFTPTLIPIGSNIDAEPPVIADREATRASLGVAGDETLLCYFGFLNASKGGETLVQVLGELVRAGCPTRLLMLGGETGASDPSNIAFAQNVKGLIARLGLDERVTWTGYRPAAEVTALWHASDIALLPYTDGASLRRGTLMAALAHAMPIVSTCPKVAVPQLRDGENIALAPAADVKALARRVLALAGSPAQRDCLSQGAALLAREFTWPSIVNRHLELYARLLVH